MSVWQKLTDWHFFRHSFSEIFQTFATEILTCINRSFTLVLKATMLTPNVSMCGVTFYLASFCTIVENANIETQLTTLSVLWPLLSVLAPACGNNQTCWVLNVTMKFGPPKYFMPAVCQRLQFVELCLSVAVVIYFCNSFFGRGQGSEGNAEDGATVFCSTNAALGQSVCIVLSCGSVSLFPPPPPPHCRLSFA